MDLVTQRFAELKDRYKCEFVNGQALRELLGYATGSAFRQAVFHKRLPIPTVHIEGRRGRHGRLLDIAKWQVEIEQRLQAEDVQGGPEIAHR